MSKEELLEENKALKAENAALKYRQKELERLIFGSKRERHTSTPVDANQGNLFEEHISPPEEVPTQQVSYHRKKAKAHPGRHPLPEHLPVEETVIEPQGVQEDWVKIGEQITETIDYTPASLIKKRVIRPKYTKPQSDEVVIADAPDRSMPKCIAEPGLIAHLINRKFVEHMPFYRQIAQFKRDYQWEIPSSTMGNWFIQVAELLTPLYEQLRKQVIASSYIQADESPIKVLDNDKPKATHQGYQWVYHSPERRLVLFDYRKGRGKAGPNEILSQYRGIVQCDGWQVYDKIARTHSEICLAGCMAHVRRKFYEAQDNDKARAHHALEQIKKLYLLERSAKQSNNRTDYRTKYMLPIIENLRIWADEQAIVVRPKSAIGKALGYFIKQYDKLLIIFKEGRMELDNNLIENKIRPLALGRKNYLFAGSHQGAQRIAIMYSFMASCYANEVNPYEWLKYTITHIHNAKIPELANYLPGNFEV